MRQHNILCWLKWLLKIYHFNTPIKTCEFCIIYTYKHPTTLFPIYLIYIDTDIVFGGITCVNFPSQPLYGSRTELICVYLSLYIAHTTHYNIPIWMLYNPYPTIKLTVIVASSVSFFFCSHKYIYVQRRWFMMTMVMWGGISK